MIAASFLVIVAAVVVCQQGVLGQLFHMSARDHGETLENMKPSITEISKEIAAVANGGEELEHVLTAVITKDLVLQVKKLNDVLSSRPGNGSNAVSCACNTCNVVCTPRQCQKCITCCVGTNCLCRTCNADDKAVKVDSVGMGQDSAFKLWSESSKMMLRSDVTKSVMATTKASDRCCSCSMCRQKSNGCGGGSCCVDGDDCACERCSSNSIDLIASSIWNPISLSPEIEKSIDKVGSLIDKLGLFMN